MPVITIGIPVYNGASFIAEALESLLSQTFEDFELIVSDNASTDDTARICEDYMSRDRRIRYFRQASTIPPAENHNFVFRKSTGRYFKWATHDDFCEPFFLEACLRVLQNDDSVVLAYPRAKIVDSEGVLLQPYSFALRTDSAAAADRFGCLIRADHRRYAGFEIYGLIRSEALRSIPPMGNYVSADRVLLTQLALIGRFHEIPDRLFVSREHDGRSVRMPPSGISLGRARLRRLIGTGPLPPLEWWDPSRKGHINFPEWRIAREHLRSLFSAHLSFWCRVRGLVEFTRWLAGDCPKLIRDLLIAAEQLFLGNPRLETAK